MTKLKSIRLIAIILCCVLCLSSCQENDEAKYNRAEKMMQEGNYFEATTLFDEIAPYGDSS